MKSQRSGRRDDESGAHTRTRRLWWSVAITAVFVFVGFQCLLIAAALQGRWWALAAPAAVCIWQAWENWKEVRRALSDE